jgi:hypothetical protein
MPFAKQFVAHVTSQRCLPASGSDETAGRAWRSSSGSSNAVIGRCLRVGLSFVVGPHMMNQIRGHSKPGITFGAPVLRHMQRWQHRLQRRRRWRRHRRCCWTTHSHQRGGSGGGGSSSHWMGWSTAKHSIGDQRTLTAHCEGMQPRSCR